MLTINCPEKVEDNFMCARFVILDDAEIAEINQILKDVNMKFDGTGIVAKTGEIFPTDNVPIVASNNGKTVLTIMKWGFPKWDKSGVIVNAKSETAAEKKMFATAIANRRIVVPSNGFYEWTCSEDEPKIKYKFNSPDSPMLYMAGLYTDYKSVNSDERLTKRFTILTRSANSDVSDIHNRMPVVLHKDEIVRWLRDYEYAKAIMSRESVSLIREAV